MYCTTSVPLYKCCLQTGRDSSFPKDRFVDRDPFVVARVPVGDIQLLVGVRAGGQKGAKLLFNMCKASSCEHALHRGFLLLNPVKLLEALVAPDNMVQ